MKKLLLLILLFCGLNATAQSVANLTGEWEYYNLEVPADAKPGMKEKLLPFFGSMYCKLNADNTYVFSMLGITETGKWSIRDKKLELTKDEGRTYNYPIENFENNLLRLKREDATIVLSRVGATVPPPASAKAVKNYAKANKTQVSKKWFMKQRPAPVNMTEVQKEAFAEALSGSYIDLKPNGKYTLETGSKKENGNWSLSDEGTAIITGSKNMPAKAFIKSVSGTELVIADSETDEEWVYSTVE